MKVCRYIFQNHGVKVASVQGNSRIGYSIIVVGRAPYLMKAKATLRDVERFVRSVANITDESTIECAKEA